MQNKEAWLIKSNRSKTFASVIKMSISRLLKAVTGINASSFSGWVFFFSSKFQSLAAADDWKDNKPNDGLDIGPFTVM